MFSSTEYQYVKDLTISFYDQGYINYVCYTNNPNNSYNTQYYDIYCYYSKSNITQNQLTFSFQENTKKCLIDTKSATSNYKNNSLTCSNNQDSSINISSKEFIYSNIPYNSNLISEYVDIKNYQNNITLYSISILCVLIILFLYKFVSKILRS